LFGRYPFLKKLFADGGYQGQKLSVRPEEGATVSSDRNRKATRGCSRVRSSVDTMGRGTDICLAGKMPEARQRLGMSEP
jgi:hypothetical protein